MQFRQKPDGFRHSALQLEKRSGHNIAECVPDQVQAQERQAEGDVPGDCVCTGCPDNPKKCNAKVLSRRVCWKFGYVRHNGRERDASFLLPC